eukprot:scaffold46236_cov26-Tisochrysis_lutea.AAC.2
MAAKQRMRPRPCRASGYHLRLAMASVWRSGASKRCAVPRAPAGERVCVNLRQCDKPRKRWQASRAPAPIAASRTSAGTNWRRRRRALTASAASVRARAASEPPKSAG